MLEIKDVFKRYKTGDYEQIALNGVSLTLRDNEFVAILGPSGSGKTTLLNIIGGLDHYDSGDLIINGVSTRKYRDRDWDTYRNHTIGFVFQSYNLIPHQSVLSNVELAMTLSGITPGERRKRALNALEKVGLKEQAHKKPNQMSGGQMQRVAIARALVNEPDIILADEPTGALDSETSIQIMDILKDVATDRLVVMVTHNPELAQQYATRIVRVKDGQIVADSNPVAASELLVEGRHQKWTKLGFLTALGLSMNNLMTKKGRTFLTAFAGAIGIIGIALILSLSNGVNQYIEDLQNDMLGTNPIQLTKTAFDLSSLMDARNEALAEMETDTEESTEREEDKIYSSNIVGTSLTATSDLIKENDLGKFKVYLDSRLEELSGSIDAVEYTYDVDPLVYRKEGDEIRMVAPGSILDSDDEQTNRMAESMLSSSWQQLITDPDLRSRQYQLLAGEWPSSYDEVALIISSNDEISDYTLYSLGVMDFDRLQKMLDAIENEEDYDDPVESFTYDDLLGREYQVFAPYQMYAKSTDSEDRDKTVWIDKSEDADFLASVYEEGLTVQITCILRATEDADISSGVAYDSSLPLKLMEMAADSEIVKQQIADPTTNVLTGEAFEKEDTETEDEKEDTETEEEKEDTRTEDEKEDAETEEAREKDTKTEETASLGGKNSEKKTDSTKTFSGKVSEFTAQTKTAAELAQTLSGWVAIEEENGSSQEGPVSRITAGSAALSDTGRTAITLSMDTGEEPAETVEETTDGDDAETAEATGKEESTETDPSGEDAEEETESTETEESVSYNIVFVDYDGSILLPLTAVAEGSDITSLAPTDPQRADTEEAKYIFVGWRSDADNAFYTSGSLPAAENNAVYTALYYEFNYNAETKQWQDSSGFSYDDLEKILMSINEQSASAAEKLQNLMNSLSSGDLIDAQQLLTALQNSGITLNDILNALGVTPQDLMDMLGISAEDVMNAIFSSMSTEDLMKLMGASSGNSTDLSGLSTEDLMKLLGIDSSSVMDNMSTEDLMKLMGIDSSSILGSMSQEDLAELLGLDSASLLDGLSEEELKELFGEDFDLEMSDDALAVLMAQMSGQTPSTYEEVLASLGYYTTDDPSGISIYPADIDGKQAIEDAIADYNDQVEEDTDRVTYTDLIATLTSTLKTIVNTISYVLIAFVAISLIVSSIMIAIITYISVLERTKEIGVLRALGASKRDVSKIFNAETFIEGLISGLLGVLVTELLCIPITKIATALVDSGTFTAFLQPQAAVILIIISVILTLIAGFAPARMAAKKDPVIALRSE